MVSNAKRVTKFLLSGGETTELFRLDTVFFRNWYGCQDEIVLGAGRMDLIQVLCVGYNVAFRPISPPISSINQTVWYIPSSV